MSARKTRDRTSNLTKVAMYSYNAGTGTWTNTGDTFNTNPSSSGGYNGSLVAGAVNLSNGKYMFGGFETIDNGRWANPRYTQVFKIWQYDPSTSPKFTYKGYVSTYAGQDDPGAANGDMAFNSLGNILIVRGSGTDTTVFSVTAFPTSPRPMAERSRLRVRRPSPRPTMSMASPSTQTARPTSVLRQPSRASTCLTGRVKRLSPQS